MARHTRRASQVPPGGGGEEGNRPEPEPAFESLLPGGDTLTPSPTTLRPRGDRAPGSVAVRTAAHPARSLSSVWSERSVVSREAAGSSPVGTAQEEPGRGSGKDRQTTHGTQRIRAACMQATKPQGHTGDGHPAPQAQQDPCTPGRGMVSGVGPAATHTRSTLGIWRNWQRIRLWTGSSRFESLYPSRS